MILTNIENKIKQLKDDTASAKGSLLLLEQQYAEATDKLDKLKKDQVTNEKSIELLNLVQRATKDLIQEMFEGVISKALTFIHQNNDYKFELEFSRHGTNPKLSFLLKTPEMQESHEILNTRAGGQKDIIALALRLVLLEVSKNKGFLFLDEPCKRLDNDETTKRTIEFLTETQRDTGRQIFIITHKDQIVNSVETPIIIK